MPMPNHGTPKPQMRIWQLGLRIRGSLPDLTAVFLGGRLSRAHRVPVGSSRLHFLRQTYESMNAENQVRVKLRDIPLLSGNKEEKNENE